MTLTSANCGGTANSCRWNRRCSTCCSTWSEEPRPGGQQGRPDRRGLGRPGGLGFDADQPHQRRPDRALGDSGKSRRCCARHAPQGHPLRRRGDARTRQAPPATPKSPHVEPGSDPLPPPIVDRPSIAVLPFENMSEDRGLELIVDGLAEDVIALLARVPGFFVIARASSFIYRPRRPNPAGRDGARRPLRRHRQRAQLGGARVRITASCRGGKRHPAVGRPLRRRRGNTLDLQDEIARRIIAELEPALTKAEFSPSGGGAPTMSMPGRTFGQALGAIAVQGWNEETIATRSRSCSQAIPIDPEFALARALLARHQRLSAPACRWCADIAAAERTAREEAERAVAIDPNASDVLGFAGCALVDIGDTERGHAILLRRPRTRSEQRASPHRIRRDRDQTRAGSKRASRACKFGMRSSPRDFRLTFWSMLLADGLRRAGRHEEAPRSRGASLAARRPALWRARRCRLRAVAARPDRRGAPDAVGGATHQAGAQPGRDQAVFRTQRRSRTGFGLELVDGVGADFAVPV